MATMLPVPHASVMTVPRLRALVTAVERFENSELEYAVELESIDGADRGEIATARRNAAQAREALTVIMVRFPKQASQLDEE